MFEHSKMIFLDHFCPFSWIAILQDLSIRNKKRLVAYLVLRYGLKSSVLFRTRQSLFSISGSRLVVYLRLLIASRIFMIVIHLRRSALIVRIPLFPA
ncbi:hypothetical protein BJV82DRAFT_146014 [Fennellomyces sp. T-0311]|nr:hypothetical protein BJV82DRAFT_146014 [Fennellomyces sp. T-0311]